MMATFKYLSGEAVAVGDVVRVVFQSGPVEARVRFVLIAGTAEALQWNAPQGGVMIESEATGLILWREPDEDMEFVRRSDTLDGPQMREFRQYELVRVVRLLHPPEHYDGWRVNKRAPAVGDTGYLIDILHAADGSVSYVVESAGSDGVDVWLGDFSAEELEPVGVTAV